MMANDSVSNAGVWRRWIQHATQAGLSLRFHVHAQDIKGRPWRTPELREYVLNTSSDRFTTRWCKALPAEWLLLRTALQDPEVTHLAAVSSDAVPLKPLGWIYRELRREPATRLCLEWTRLASQREPRAETWFLMRRADAELFVQNQRFAERVFFEGIRRSCQEERMWAIPLILRSFQWGQQRAPLSDSCIMFTDWGDTRCKAWAVHVNMSDFSSLRARSTFTEAAQSYGHPRTYRSVGAGGVQDLQRSPFWWARKFAAGAVRPRDFDFAPDGVAGW